MEKREPSAAALEAFDAIVTELAASGAVLGNTFGAKAIMLNKKATACLNGDAMSFKLGRDSAEHASALALEGALLFDPSGMGRPFKDWVEVPLAHSEQWGELAQSAIEFAAGAA
ncbi:hypothetical protein ACQR35_08980 [Pseudarthrobacter sp. J1738]|uniref:hypothetical protein n=1 Tax=unclassified Pseudarthrobacter TaxID=2647000 RepID=UPI003D2DA3AD